VYFVFVRARSEPYRASRLLWYRIIDRPILLSSLGSPCPSQIALRPHLRTPYVSFIGFFRFIFSILPSSLGPCASPSRRPLLFPFPFPFPSYFVQCPIPQSRRLYANPSLFPSPNQVPALPPARGPPSSSLLGILSFPSTPYPCTCSRSPPHLPTGPSRYSIFSPPDR
jgi:hypothetical protein